jgi:hypothetical protein
VLAQKQLHYVQLALVRYPKLCVLGAELDAAETVFLTSNRGSSPAFLEGVSR